METNGFWVKGHNHWALQMQPATICLRQQVALNMKRRDDRLGGASGMDMVAYKALETFGSHEARPALIIALKGNRIFGVEVA